jgi:hypothetical protein
MARIAAIAAKSGRWSAHALRLQAFATFRYAQDFHHTATKAGSNLVRAYLLGHAVEMYLKAYLLHAGLSATTLKRKPFGHNLDRLLIEAKTRGFTSHLRITPALEADIALLNQVYPETLRYFSLLHLFVPPHIPALARLFRFAKSTEQALKKIVKV